MNAAGQALAMERELRAVGTPERAAQEKAYLKSELDFVGASVPDIRRAVRSWDAQHSEATIDDVMAVVQALWTTRIQECRLAGVVLLETHADRLRPGDVAEIEALLRQAGTWALVDGLAVKVMGVAVEHHPQLTDTLDRWSCDEDFWIRRAAVLALLLPLRRGAGDIDRFFRYADTMLEEREFFIRKALGWVLRETAKRRPDLVDAWLLPRVGRASGVTVREAVKPLSAERRDALMEAYRASRAG